MEPTNQLNSLKQQAELNALKKLQIQFSTYEQLEQIEQHMNRNEKRKVKALHFCIKKKNIFNFLCIYFLELN